MANMIRTRKFNVLKKHFANQGLGLEFESIFYTAMPHICSKIHQLNGNSNRVIGAVIDDLYDSVSNMHLRYSRDIVSSQINHYISTKPFSDSAENGAYRDSLRLFGIVVERYDSVREREFPQLNWD